jgi:hypothetical protein
MVPGFDDAKTTEMRARLDDRLGLWAVTYLLFFVKLGPGLALFLVLVFAIWIGWRWLCRKCPAVALGRVVARHAPCCAAPPTARRFWLSGPRIGWFRAF